MRRNPGGLPNGWALTGSRSGFTLLEILVSTAIFVASLAGIMQVLNTGHRARIEAVLDAEAALRCETITGELLAGVHVLDTTSEQAFDDNPSWVWSVDVTDEGSTDLLRLDVEVSHKTGGDRVNSTFSLTRLVRDPQMFADAAGEVE